jgi:hypothetical protein
MNNTLNRPLFRQMGGPAAPMPQDMMPPQGMMPPMSPEEEVIDAEQSAEMAGREFVANMMGNIDAAEDVTSMINALRGNDAPLESRYSELAGYVGEADASQTPESVLAMVQPAIMLTEEGAIDSGIGELMSKMAGSEMETPDGSPTPMGQGVGELMAMGAGSTPPVNFRNGGPVEVRRFATGTPPTGNSSVISEAQRMAPAYQKFFAGAMDSEARAADLEEQKRLSQAQILFDIAQTALAAGAPTATPMSAAERIAGAVGQTQLFDKVGQRSAGLLQAKQAQAAEDRQLRMAGLQAALGQAQTNKAAADALGLHFSPTALLLLNSCRLLKVNKALRLKILEPILGIKVLKLPQSFSWLINLKLQTLRTFMKLTNLLRKMKETLNSLNLKPLLVTLLVKTKTSMTQPNHF